MISARTLRTSLSRQDTAIDRSLPFCADAISLAIRAMAPLVFEFDMASHFSSDVGVDVVLCRCRCVCFSVAGISGDRSWSAKSASDCWSVPEHVSWWDKVKERGGQVPKVP